MRKLSEINESIWRNISQRSEGIKSRKEDDVNHMDIISFCEYLNKTYKCRGDRSITYYNFHYDGHEGGIDTLVVTLYEDRHGYMTYLYYDGIHIDTQLYVLKELKCFDEFTDKFSSKITHGDQGENIEILPKDKNTPITNRFFLEVLNFLLDKIKYPLIPDIEKNNNLKESIWRNISQRSEGIKKRKEDDINKLDFHEFVSYLKDTYTIDDPTNFFEIGIYPTMGTDIVNISIPIEKKDIYTEQKNGNRFLSIGKNKKTDEFVNIRPNKYIFQLYPRELVKTFKDDFCIDYDLFELIPKNGKITNSMCVDVIDKLLSIVERPIMTKK